MLTDHLELPDGALKSVDALVTKSDGVHFLLAAVHFVLSAKPALRHEGKLRGSKAGTSLKQHVAAHPTILGVL
jgi:hypothetical protein